MLFLCLGAVILIILGFLEYYGWIWHNELFARKYSVKGLDVSHHQNKINWQELRQKHNFEFIFMKATEGHDHTDTQFQYNWHEAKKNGFLVGAYHFFSMRSSGKQQAQHFIKTVPDEPGRLPPVIDVEIHLNHPVDKAKKELYSMLTELEKHYHQKPILYVTYDTYHQYIEGDFQEYPIWFRDILKPPSIGDRQWLFWQYSNRGRVEGIDTYVDLNVYSGSLEQLRKLIEKNQPSD